MGLVKFVFRLARLSADTKAVTSGDPKRIGRRTKNKLLGRDLGKAGFWCWLGKVARGRHMRRLVTLSVALLGVALSLACANENTPKEDEPTMRAIQEVARATDVRDATSVPATITDAPSTATEPPLRTATELPPPTNAPVPTVPLVTNRRSCDAIRGTSYRSEEERQWFLATCIALPPTQPPPAPLQPPAQSCHPSYVGACLLPNASDYDCRGGSGNGPYYTGRVRVVGPDKYGLDRDGDGIGCE